MIRKFCNNCGRLVGNFRSDDPIPALCPVCEAGPSFLVLVFAAFVFFVLAVMLIYVVTM